MDEIRFDTLYERLKDRLEVEEIGQIPLKGKSNGVNVFSVKALIGGPLEPAKDEEKAGKKAEKKVEKRVKQNA